MRLRPCLLECMYIPGRSYVVISCGMVQNHSCCCPVLQTSMSKVWAIDSAYWDGLGCSQSNALCSWSPPLPMMGRMPLLRSSTHPSSLGNCSGWCVEVCTIIHLSYIKCTTLNIHPECAILHNVLPVHVIWFVWVTSSYTIDRVHVHSCIARSLSYCACIMVHTAQVTQYTYNSMGGTYDVAHTNHFNIH